MNDSNEFGTNNNFGINDNLNVSDNNGMPNEPVTYDSYYNHQPRKKPWVLILLLLIVIIGVLVSLYLSGVFTPVDRQAEYNKLYNRVCNAAVSYANTNKKDEKDNVGKIVYITTGNLIDANLVEATLTNYLTNETIPSTTHIKLEVLPNKTFQCHGFLWSGDDTTKPIVTLKGESTITSPAGQKVSDPGATATDNEDGDISEKIKRSGNVNTSVPGTYYVRYSVSDISGNLSDIVVRTYIIQ